MPITSRGATITNDGKSNNVLKIIYDTNFTMIHKKEHTFIHPDLIKKRNRAIDLTITSITIASHIIRQVSDMHIDNSGLRVIYSQKNT